MKTKKIISAIKAAIIAATSTLTFAAYGLTAFAMTGNTVEEQVYHFLKEEAGVTNDAAIAGLLSNIQEDSNFDPKAHVADENGDRYGLCLWYGPRLQNLKAYCSSNKYAWDSAEGQIRFMKHEWDTYFRNIDRLMHNKTNSKDYNYPDTADGAESFGDFLAVQYTYYCGDCNTGVNAKNIYYNRVKSFAAGTAPQTNAAEAPTQPAPAQAAQPAPAPAPTQAAQPAPTQAAQPAPAPAPAQAAQPAPAQANLGSCGKAYDQAIKAYDSKKYNNYKYSLIYCDDDNTPELVIDTGARVSIYTCENSTPRCIVKNEHSAKWKYGTSSLCYAPKKALYFENSNNSFGCILVDSKTGDGYPFVTHSISNMHFYPKVGEVVPSEGADFPDPSTPATFKDHTDASKSADQVEKDVAVMFGYEWQRVQGTMDYNTLIAKLQEMGI